MMEKYKHQILTRQIIKAYYIVYNELGPGFLESVYENAMVMTLNEFGLEIKVQFPVKVYFKNIAIGEFKADMIVEDKVLVELKSVAKLLPVHKAQLINYLKATRIEIGLLMNFGDKPEFKRFIFNKT